MESVSLDQVYNNDNNNNSNQNITNEKKLNENQRKKYLVGLVDDIRCELHIQELNHQESPDRVRAIRNKLKTSGLYDKLVLIEPIEATKNDLLLVHTNKYINKVVRVCTDYTKGIIDCSDVRVTGQGSLVAAGVAVSCVLGAVNTVLTSNHVRKVFCNVRPPGHHASSHEASGFCIFNNVAIGVKKALKHPKIKKVLIFDWDLHHGDGTERIFKCSKNVMFVSFHRAKPFYPNTGDRDFKGKYYNVHNFPIYENDTGDDYMKMFYEEFLPKAKDFAPDIIFISCGFDGHKDDMYHGLPLTNSHYKIMTKELCQLANKYCDGRLISVLEGGYTPEVIAECTVVHVDELLHN